MGQVTPNLSSKDRDALFGGSSSGSVDEQAKKSSRLFVRSQDHLAFFTPKAKGQQLTAFETLRNFGEQRLIEILNYGSAILVSDPEANGQQPGKRIRWWREHLGISVSALAKRTGISASEIERLEKNVSRISASNVARICTALSLDEYKVGLEEITQQERDRGYRFKELQSDHDEFGSRLTASSALSLLEDAWLVSKQNKLRKMLGRAHCYRSKFDPDPNYGSPNFPAWRVGYELAVRTREILGIPEDRPIENLRDLVEKRLEIPLIQDELSPGISGATVQLGQDRGIVVNVKGNQHNPLSARLTIAHELGHLLWDPDQELKTLVVDRNAMFSIAPWSEKSTYVEQRANAFAVEFLAPRAVVKRRYPIQEGPPENIYEFLNEFGVSFTAARYHIWNATGRVWELKDIKTEEVDASGDWAGRENFLATFVPYLEVKNGMFPTNRRGQFLTYVIDAEREKLISEDTAALYLGIEKKLLQVARRLRDELFD